MKDTIVEKWSGCIHSLVDDGGDGESSQELRQEGIYQSYLCNRREVVKSGRFRLTGYGYIAVLHQGGSLKDPGVTEALKRSCESCQYYKKDVFKD